MHAPPQPPPGPRRVSGRTIEFLLEQVQGQIKIQEEQWSSLRTKATVILGSAGLVFARLIEVRLVSPGHVPPIWTRSLYPWLATFLLLASLASLISLLPYKIRSDPNPGPFVRRYLGRSASSARLHLLPNLIQTYEHNRGVLQWVARPLLMAVIALIVALVLFFVLALSQWEVQWHTIGSMTPATAVAPSLAPQTPVASPIYPSPTPTSSTTVRVSAPRRPSEKPSIPKSAVARKSDRASARR